MHARPPARPPHTLAAVQRMQQQQPCRKGRGPISGPPEPNQTHIPCFQLLLLLLALLLLVLRPRPQVAAVPGALTTVVSALETYALLGRGAAPEPSDK